VASAPGFLSTATPGQPTMLKASQSNRNLFSTEPADHLQRFASVAPSASTPQPYRRHTDERVPLPVRSPSPQLVWLLRLACKKTIE